MAFFTVFAEGGFFGLIPFVKGSGFELVALFCTSSMFASLVSIEGIGSFEVDAAFVVNRLVSRASGRVFTKNTR